MNVFSFWKKRRGSDSEQIRLQHQASAGRLAAAVVHEVNNPLTSLVAGVSIMRRSLEKNDLDQKLKLYEEQKKATDRIANIIRGLSMYARIEGDIDGRVDLHALLFGVATCLECIFPKNKISLDLSLKSKHPFIQGIHCSIQQQVMDRIIEAAGLLRDPLVPRTAKKAEQRSIRLETVEQEGQLVLRMGDEGSIWVQAFPLWRE